MPTPASPISVTMCGLPSRTTRAKTRLEHGRARRRGPTSGDSSDAPRAHGLLPPIRPTASHAGTGSDLPFSVERLELRRSGSACWVARTVRSPTVTAPGRPADWSREATFTVSPVTV